MPSVSTLSSDDKAKVKKGVPTSSSTNKIVTAAVARVYQAKQGARSWSYAGVEGALVFCADKAKGGLWFRIVDLTSHRGVIWEHELPNEIEYNQEKPFFHTWQGDATAIAFVFAAENEAHDFYKKVANRSKYATKVKEDKKEKTTPTKKSKKGGKIDKSLISGPSAGSFKHVAHMGFDSEKGFSSTGVDPSWQVLLEQLTSRGISPKEIQKNEQFIKDFVQQQGGIEKASTPRKPPPFPAPTSRRKPAPPPPSSRPSRPNSLATPSAPPAPPPPPNRASMTPSIPSPATPSAPPPPPRSSGVPPPPPPIPPPTSAPSRGGPPPPPPLPAGRSGGAPPPPPAPPPGGRAPPTPSGGGGGRSALLASIQGSGLHNLKKVDSNEQRAAPLAGGGATGSTGGGGATPSAMPAAEDNPDLASSLAAALARRKGDLGDSDEEEESEGEWD